MKKVIFKFFGLSTSFAIIVSIFLLNNVFANVITGGVKITSPKQGAVVHPGETITVTLEAYGDFVVKSGSVDFLQRMGQDGETKLFTFLPATLTIAVPTKAIAGSIGLNAFAQEASGNTAGDAVVLQVQQTATVQSIGNPRTLDVYLDWNNKITTGKTGDAFPGGARYSDGIVRDVPRESFTYVSSDPVIVAVDSQGFYQVLKVGDATITTSLAGVSQIDTLVFHQPTGIRPSETIPPVTTMQVTPQPNAVGWWNSDITINLTAQDNEGGSGMDEIIYSLQSNGKEQYAKGNSATIVISQEGKDTLEYDAVDKERNHEQVHTFTANLDKTPPQVTLSATPSVLWPPNNKMVNVTISGQATDVLSGIDTVTFKVVDSYGTCQPTIAGFGSTIQMEASRKGNDKNGRVYTIIATAKDKAGNQTMASTTVTVPHDQGK